MNTKIKLTIAIFFITLITPYFPVEAKVNMQASTSSKKVLNKVVAEPRFVVSNPKSLPNPVIETVKPKAKVVKSTPKVQNTAPETQAIQADKELVKKRICEVFGSECKNALIIAEHESGFRTNALSRTGDYGVFQINCRWQGKRVGGNCNAFYDLETNLRVAKQIYSEQGWRPWSTRIYLK